MDPRGSSAFKMLFEGENQQEIGKSIIFKYVYWYMKQISGERLQDHWSSDFQILLDPYTYICEIPGKNVRTKLAAVRLILSFIMRTATFTAQIFHK